MIEEGGAGPSSARAPNEIAKPATSPKTAGSSIHQRRLDEASITRRSASAAVFVRAVRRAAKIIGGAEQNAHLEITAAIREMSAHKCLRLVVALVKRSAAEWRRWPGRQSVCQQQACAVLRGGGPGDIGEIISGLARPPASHIRLCLALTSHGRNWRVAQHLSRAILKPHRPDLIDALVLREMAIEASRPLAASNAPSAPNVYR